MSLQQRIEQQQQIQDYLQRKNIYKIFQEMIEDILINCPQNPIDFMIEHLGKNQRCIVVVIGPPGVEVYKVAEEGLNGEIRNQFKGWNTGVFLGNNIEKFSKEVQLLYQQLRLIIDDEVSEKILNEISKFCGENPYAIIEGYPKYLKQALNFEKKIGVPNVVIFVNVNQKQQQKIWKQELKRQNKKIQNGEIEVLYKNILEEYKINMKELKRYYTKYLEIDVEIENKDKICKDIIKCMGLNFGASQPRKNTRIVIVGAPFSGRTTLGKKIAAKYNLIYVSTAVLIAQQIRRGTVVGRKIRDKYLANQLVDNFTVEKLLEERISKLDCEMEGYVIQGYPKTLEQLQSLKTLHINPNFIIGLNPSQEILRTREGVKQNNQFTKREMERVGEVVKGIKKYILGKWRIRD